MLTALTAAILAASAPAAAADHQVDLDLGVQGAGYDNEDWDLFSDSDALSTYGARVGVALGEHLSVLVGYQRGVTGAEIYQDSYWEDDGVDAPGDEFVAAYYSHTLALGPKLSARASRVLSPYGTLLLTGQYATVRLDADPVIDDDATQLTATGMAPGAVAAAGLDVALPFKQRAWTPATFAELGYGHTLALDFDSLGELSFSGVYLRWGVGVRF